MRSIRNINIYGFTRHFYRHRPDLFTNDIINNDIVRRATLAGCRNGEYTGRWLFTAKTMDDKKQQKLFFFWYLRENQHTIINLLRKYGRGNPIGRLFRE